MGVLKLALIVVLLVSVSVTVQEEPIVEENEKIVSENAVDNAQDVVEETPVIALDREPPVTILTTNKPVIVTKPIDTEAVNFDPADGTLNRSQWRQPTESPTNVTNECGKHKSVSVL